MTASKASTRDAHRRAVMDAIVAAERDLAADVSLERMAKAAAMAPFHFHRSFRALMGEAPAAYVRRLRLQHAASRLRLEETAVQRIGQSVGYHAPEAFTRAFTDCFGVTPSVFRERERAQPHAPTRIEATRIEPVDARPFARERVAHDEVFVEDVPTLRVAFERFEGEYAAMGGGQYFERVVAICRTSLRVGVVRDDPIVTGGHGRFDACVLVDDGFKPAVPLAIQTLPGGRHASVTHAGSLHGVPMAYARLVTLLLPSLGLILRPGPVLKLYLTSEATPDDEKLTDVLVPVA